jgi:hypothetical protein
MGRVTDAADVAARAALISTIPDMLVCLLGIVHIIHPIMLGARGSPYLHDGRIAFVYVRGPNAVPDGPLSLLEVLVIEPCIMIVSGTLIGILGGALGHVLSHFRVHPHQVERSAP